MSNALLIIDPQNDFCNPNGTLFVSGADKDCGRLAEFIDNNSSKISSIHITLDSHPTYHIAHPEFWMDENGNNPKPFTIITHQDYVKGMYKPRNSLLEQHVEEYLMAYDVTSLVLYNEEEDKPELWYLSRLFNSALTQEYFVCVANVP